MSKRLEYIAKAQEITDQTFSEIIKYIKPGLSDWQVAQQLKQLIHQYGGDQELAFPSLVCSGVRTALFHGPTSKNKIIKKGEPIYLDFGAKYRGWCSDMTRTLFVGQPKKELEAIYKIVLNVQKKQISMVKAGVKVAEIDQKGRDILKKHDLAKYFTHTTGHGLGKNVHQRPRISWKSKAILKEGDVITIEPGVYLPNKYGVRIEDLLIVTAQGYRNLTKSAKNLVIC